MSVLDSAPRPIPRKPQVLSTWLALPISIGVVLVFTGVRALLLSGLERGAPYLTYYPAVMVAAVLGGWPGGLCATLTSAGLTFFWIQGGRLNEVEWLAMSVFLLSCLMMTAMAGAMRQAQARAVVARDQAEAANRAKSAFLASMSHELRTPLNAVLGFTNLMLDEEGFSATQRGYLDTVARSGEHLLNLINNVLDISKIEAGYVALEESPTSLIQLLEDIRSMMTYRASEKGLKFRVETLPGLPPLILVDQGKLRQVLINLVGNAIKYTDKGKITLRASYALAKAPGRGSLHFAVEDTGPGVKPEDRERIFEPFVRLVAPASKVPGSGLGLAISSKYVELMGGRLSVVEGPVQGSIFRFDIPVDLAEGPSPQAEFGQRQVVGLLEPTRTIRVLIADDNDENRLLLRLELAHLGFDLREVVDGNAAVELCQDWKPDLIWMDIGMPVMDGLEATRCIRANPALSGIKIIALTAHAMEEERGQILAAGFDGFIKKPWRLTEILETMSDHLGLVYRFREAGPVHDASLKSLPVGFVRDLHLSAVALDGEGILEEIQKIEALDEPLGAYLRTMASRLDYGRIADLLEPLLKETPHGD